MGVLHFVVGGAASGKSAFAERLTRAAKKPKVYVATMQPFDDEMRAKLNKHQAMRGADWHTIEAPLDPGKAITEAGSDQIVLLDCVTLWLSNVLLADRDVEVACDQLLQVLANALCEVVVVSNEVGMGIVPDNALSRQFRNAQGRLNQRLAVQANNVVTVIAGLPIVLKGQLEIAPEAKP